MLTRFAALQSNTIASLSLSLYIISEHKAFVRLFFLSCKKYSYFCLFCQTAKAFYCPFEDTFHGIDIYTILFGAFVGEKIKSWRRGSALLYAAPLWILYTHAVPIMHTGIYYVFSIMFVLSIGWKSSTYMAIL